MNQQVKSLFSVLFLCAVAFLLLFSSSFAAKKKAQPTEVSKKNAEVQALFKTLDSRTTLEEIATMRENIERISQAAQERITVLQEEISQLNTAMQRVEGGGPNGEGGREESAVINTELSTSKVKKEAELADYKLFVLVCQEKLAILEKARKKRLARNLIYRGVNIVSIWQGVLVEGEKGWQHFFSLQNTILDEAEIEKLSPNYLSILPAAALLFFIALQQMMGNILQQYAAKGNLLYYLDLFLLKKHFLFNMLVAFSAIVVIVSWINSTRNFNALIGSWLSIFLFYLVAAPLGLRAMLYRLLISRFSVYIGFESKEVRFFWVLFSLLLALLILHSSTMLSHIVPPDIFNLSLFFSLSFCLLFLVVAIRILQKKYLSSFIGKFFYRLLLLVSFFLIAAEGAGYHNLVSYLLSGIGKTVILLGLLLLGNDTVNLLIRMGSEMSAALLLRLTKDEDDDVAVPPDKSFMLMSLSLKLLLYLTFFYLFISVWGAMAQPGTLSQIFAEGIHLGGFSFFPARLIAALAALLAGFAGVYCLKQAASWFWLRHWTISKNSRETILTLAGYFCSALLILVALEVAGVKLTGLSMIFGALSVGIGFGLQNVVNNFISGLILMFEQPIRRGNWVKVGDEQGYVKKISIRSTVIQTFDQSDVIVPNSEIIAAKVTNMTLHDTRGRLKISVGVAYGSDTRLVEKLLLRAAHSNPHLDTSLKLQPRVYFQSFGESSLDFILSCYLSDINDILSVRSELNFEIDRLFRENKIVIPFPQRDIIIKKERRENFNDTTTD